MYAKFVVEVGFDYHSEEDYCETFIEIMQRLREQASAEVIGTVTRTENQWDLSAVNELKS